jgi:hypothetical protein
MKKRRLKKTPISVDVVRKIYSYDPGTGELVKIKTGKPVGGASEKHLYKSVTINGDYYLLHRVAWALMTGKWPEREIDHRDRNLRNNTWANLREATPQQNKMNAVAQRNNKSGFKGVTYYEGRPKPWRARIGIDNRLYWLGSFSTAEEAYAAYMAEAVRRYGEFARGNE